MKLASSTVAVKQRTGAKTAGTALGLATLVTAASLVAAAPANASSFDSDPGSPTHAHAVDIIGTNNAMTDSFKINTHGIVPAGLVKIRFTNTGTMDHQAQLFRLHDGVTYAKFLADLNGSNPFSAFLVDSSADGGPATMAPGREQTVWEPMQGGTYAVVCLVSDNGVPHFAKGMVSELTVAGHMSPEDLAEVHPAGEIEGVIHAHDMIYTMPSVIRIGALYRFKDTDAQDTHEVTFGKLLPGKTAADAKAWFASFAKPGGPSGPPPFVYAGGFGAELPGNGGWLRANLTPGNYVAFCLVPDDKTGLPHAAMGMVVGFRAAPDYDD